MFTFLFFHTCVCVYVYYICHMSTNSINLVIPKSKYNFDLFVYMTLWHPNDQL